VDKTITNAYHEIEIDPDTQLPVHIKVVILTGTKGGNTEAKGKSIVGGKHVAFHFDYSLSEFGKLQKPTIPPEVMKMLVKK
jgi:hypothetical protein